MADIDTILFRYEGAIADLVSATREFLLANLPGSIEEPDPKAGIIGYQLGPGYKGSVCTIIPSKKEVKLGIVRGAELPDLDGLLEGTGKVHRYVVIRSKKDLASPALRSLLHLAAEACRRRLSERR